MRRYQSVVQNISKTVGASSMQLVITLITTPIMTRLYTPEAYAVFGMITTATALLVGVGLLSLTNAYTAEKDAARRGEMLHAMLLLLVMTALGATLIAAMLYALGWLHLPALALACLPLLVLSYGLRNIIVNIGIQRGMFSRLSLTQITEPLIGRGGSVALGALLGGHPLLVLFANMAGHFSTILLLLKRLPREVYGHWRGFFAARHQLSATLRRLGDFVVFGTASAQAQQAISFGIQAGIAGFFSGHLAGQYIFATSILTLPISVIALATAPVVYHHFMQTEPTRLKTHFLVATFLYLLAALIIFIPLKLYGAPLFALIFGAVWEQAGQIAGTLSLAYAGMFVATGVQSVFMVTRRLRLQWYSEILTAIPAIVAGVYCFKTMDFSRAVFYLSCIWLIRTLCILIAAFYASASRTHATEPPAS